MPSRGKAGLARHLEAVADLCAELAGRQGLNPCRARMAAMMHDWLKPLSPARLAVIMRQCGVTMDNETGKSPKLWHGPAAAAIACQRAGMRDHEVLEAVRWHTTGKAGMSALGQALFVADYCSTDRKFHGAVEGRRLARRNLSLGVRYVLASKLAWLMESGISPHGAALGFWRSIFPELARG